MWNALTGLQAGFAQGDGRARRYPPWIEPFAAVRDMSPESFADLARLVPPGESVALPTIERIDPPLPFRLVSVRALQQLVAHAPPPDGTLPCDALGPADAPEMLALARMTEPGPFETHTHELGRFVGLRDGDQRLIAMAGERMRLTGYTEISGVCVHPDHRGRGHAIGLMAEIWRGILKRGETPFLHVFADNHGALALYERLGFVIRRRFWLHVIERSIVGA